MTSDPSTGNAEPITIEHSGRTISALEWRSASSGPPLVIAVEGDVAAEAGPVAQLLAERYRVIGLNLDSRWNAVIISWWAADPVVLLAQGRAGEIACKSAALSPGAIRALALADFLPGDDYNLHSDLKVPVLVFHGRESNAKSHGDAVRLRDEIPGSHLIELDGCGELPTENCAIALAESLTWFLDELGKPVIEFSGFPGHGAAPVDPKS